MSDETPKQDDIKITRRKLAEYRKNPKNPNKGTRRGDEMLRESYDEFGAVAALLADRDSDLVDGNHRIDAALAAGIEDVIEIEKPPNAQIIIKDVTLDLDDPDDVRARKLSHLINYSSDVGHDYEVERLLELHEEGALEGVMRPDEIDDLIEQAMKEDVVAEALKDDKPERSQRSLGDQQKQIKAVLYVDELTAFEQAIQLASELNGLRNRGASLIAVCDFYLEHAGGDDASGSETDPFEMGD